MKRRNRVPVAAALVLGLIAAWDGVRGEVSTTRGSNDHARTLVMGDTRVGITDGADPVLDVPWDTYRPTNNHDVLNANGSIRPDGRPDIFFQSSKQWPVVVWAYNNGPDHDIAYSEWSGNGWTPMEMLTSGPEDEVDPRVFVTDEGAIYVTWWVNAEVPYVMATSRRLTTTDWDQPIRVSDTGESSLRPTIMQFEGVVRVAYELGTPGGIEALTARELIVRRRSGNSFVLDHTFNATDPGALNPLLASTSSTLYMTWRDSAGRFGCSVRTDNGWSEPFYEPIEDSSWIGVEIVRINLKRAIQGMPDTVPGEPGDPGDLGDGTSGTSE
jgi:hypothetical protein